MRRKGEYEGDGKEEKEQTGKKEQPTEVMLRDAGNVRRQSIAKCTKGSSCNETAGALTQDRPYLQHLAGGGYRTGE